MILKSLQLPRAGKFFVERKITLMLARIFAIETTLSGTWINRAITQAITRNFFVRLFYVCLASPEQSIQRVHERVVQGGHSVPDEDVRRRYARSLLDAKKALTVVNEATFFDNSGIEPTPILKFRGGTLIRRVADLPRWGRNLL